MSGYTTDMTLSIPTRRNRGIPAVIIDSWRLMNMVREGATNAELADAFGCCGRTLERWRKRNPEVNEAIIAERTRQAEWLNWPSAYPRKRS